MEPTCRDIEEAIQGAWDRGAPAPLEGAIGAHCRACPTCRVWLTRAAGWSAVLAGLRPVPATRDLSEALLAAWVLERDRPRATWRPRLALAASALVAAGLALWGGFRAPEGGGQITEAHPPERVELAQSLRDATSATLDLARLTSEPAARVGIKFLAAATRPITPDLPGPASLSPPGRSLGVGEQVERGIKPISGSVRKAFEFLLPSADASDDPSPRRT
jgi:hypothetical protein